LNESLVKVAILIYPLSSPTATKYLSLQRWVDTAVTPSSNFYS
jgi:hypothetical protein